MDLIRILIYQHYVIQYLHKINPKYKMLLDQGFIMNDKLGDLMRDLDLVSEPE